MTDPQTCIASHPTIGALYTIVIIRSLPPQTVWVIVEALNPKPETPFFEALGLARAPGVANCEAAFSPTFAVWFLGREWGRVPLKGPIGIL